MSPPGRLHRGVILWCSMPAIALAWVVLLPFLTKAYTIDDVTFLLEAKHVLQDPLHPAAFDMVFHGLRIRLSQELVSGPVMAYLLVPAIMLGGAEWVAHVVQIILLSLAVISTGSLALRLGWSPWQATLACVLLVASPAVLAMTATAMPDISAMAFGVMALDRVVAWSMNGRWRTGIAAAFLLILAALSRPHALIQFVCAAYWLLTIPRAVRPWTHAWFARQARELLPVTLAVAGLFLFNELTRDPQGGVSLADTTAYRSEDRAHFWINLANFPLQWVVAFPLAFLWPSLRREDFLRRPRTYIAFAVGVTIAWLGEYLPLAAFIGLGTAVLVDICFDGWQSRNRVKLLLAGWLMIGVSASPYAHLPAKYLVVSAPAMALLLSSFEWERIRYNQLMTATVLTLGVVLGVLIIKADTALAEIGREGGRVAANYRRQDSVLWLDGGWGFQWYAMAAGAQPLATTSPFPRSGDLVVVGPKGWLVEHRYPNKTLLYRRIFDAPGGRVMGDGAGFYTSGPLPWTWGRSELGRIEVWRLRRTGD